MLHIVSKPNSDNDGGSAKINITWEENQGGLQCDAEQATKEAVTVSKMVLKCEFEMFEDDQTANMGCWRRELHICEANVHLSQCIAKKQGL